MHWDTDLLILAPTILLSLGMFFRYRLRSLQGDRHETERLSHTIDELQLEMDELRAEQAAANADLQERLDFAERLLTRGERSEEQKRVITPV